jgi:hypothetical protein
MAFVNEEISQEDYNKYDIGQFVKRFGSISPSKNWIIDRDRDIWLRLYRRAIDIEDNGAELWTSRGFYWKGVFITLDTKFLEHTYIGSTGCMHIKILELEIPKEAEQYKQEILKDLKEAFEASYNDKSTTDGEIKSWKVDLIYEWKLL